MGTGVGAVTVMLKVGVESSLESSSEGPEKDDEDKDPAGSRDEEVVVVADTGIEPDGLFDLEVGTEEEFDKVGLFCCCPSCCCLPASIWEEEAVGETGCVAVALEFVVVAVADCVEELVVLPFALASLLTEELSFLCPLVSVGERGELVIPLLLLLLLLLLLPLPASSGIIHPCVTFRLGEAR